MSNNKNTYGHFMFKVLNLHMKRICEPVIIGLKFRKITERSTIMVNIQLRRIISIGNHIISSAIWNK